MKVKKLIVFLLVTVSLAFGVFAVAAKCSDLPDNSDGVTIKLIVLDLDNSNLFEKELLTTKSTLYDSFNEFEGIEVTNTSSFLGAYVTAVAIGTIENDENWGPFFNETARIAGNFASNTYIAVYHDLDKDNLKDLLYDNLSYEGKNYFYSGVGVSKLPLYDGCTYILKLSEW